MEAVTVSPKFQVVIPQAVRESLGLTPGLKMQVVQKLRGQIYFSLHPSDLFKPFCPKRINHLKPQRLEIPKRKGDGFIFY